MKVVSQDHLQQKWVYKTLAPLLKVQVTSPKPKDTTTHCHHKDQDSWPSLHPKLRGMPFLTPPYISQLLERRSSPPHPKHLRTHSLRCSPCELRMPPATGVNKRCCCQQASSRPNCVPWEDSGWRKAGYWPYIVKAHIKGIISVRADSCIFPYIGTY